MIPFVTAAICNGGAMADDLSRAVGRVALVQMDNRYCTRSLDWKLSLDVLRAAWFWWKSVEINALWAERHGYDHLVFCSRQCAATARNGSKVSRAPSWCKLSAVATILQARAHDTVVFIDSDAYIRETLLSLPAMLESYLWAGDGFGGARAAADGPPTSRTMHPSLFFACNHPFVNGWPLRPRGPRSDSGLPTEVERQLIRRGPPNTGFWLARASPSALRALRIWWRARWQERDDAPAHTSPPAAQLPEAHREHAWQRPPRSWAWHERWQEQGALWDLMLSNDSYARPESRLRAAC